MDRVETWDIRKLLGATHITEVPWMRNAFVRGYSSYLDLVGGEDAYRRVASLLSTIDIGNHPVLVAVGRSGRPVIIDGMLRIRVAAERGVEKLPVRVVELECYSPGSVEEAKRCVELFLEAHSEKHGLAKLRILVAHILDAFSRERTGFAKGVAEVARRYLTKLSEESESVQVPRNYTELITSVKEIVLETARREGIARELIEILESELDSELPRISRTTAVWPRVKSALHGACLGSAFISKVSEELRRFSEETGIRLGLSSGATESNWAKYKAGCIKALAKLLGISETDALNLINTKYRHYKMFRTRTVSPQLIAAIYAIESGKDYRQAAKMLGVSEVTVKDYVDYLTSLASVARS